MRAREYTTTEFAALVVAAGLPNAVVRMRHYGQFEVCTPAGDVLVAVRFPYGDGEPWWVQHCVIASTLELGPTGRRIQAPDAEQAAAWAARLVSEQRDTLSDVLGLSDEQ